MLTKRGVFYFSCAVLGLSSCGDDPAVQYNFDIVPSDTQDTAGETSPTDTTDVPNTDVVPDAGDTIDVPDGTDIADAPDASDVTDIQPDVPPAVCGDGAVGVGEVCDGTNLNGQSCLTRGFVGGELACRADCAAFVTAACTGECTADCTGRECGIEPICGENCGECGEGEECGATGACGPIVQPPACGNGVSEPGELCDGADVGTTNCTAFGFDRGTLLCSGDCRSYSFAECETDEVDPPVCGNGVRELGELCDGADVGSVSCTNFEYDRGTLGCAATCNAYVFSGCVNDPIGSVCGNGLLESGEACDPPNFGGATCVSLGFDRGVLSCSGDCRTINTGACESDCEPQCAGRQCGLDPLCGISCGTCASGFSCTTAGACQADSAGGPRFIRFATNVTDVSEGESVQFTAVVTDPDGIDDLIGGTLLDPGTGSTYGAFATSAAEGSYTLNLTWGEIHRVQAINFTADIRREFEAEFFDVDGNRASQRLTLTLTCDGEGACDGVCTDLTTVSNCGTCGTECDAGGLCSGGSCACPVGQADCGGDRCVSLSTTTNCVSCGVQCTGGSVCSTEGCVCPVGTELCNGTCVSTTTDENCGGCDITCGLSGVCSSGACTTCGGDERLCGGRCGSEFNVNTCGDACARCTDAQTCNGLACIPATEGSVRISSMGVLEILHSSEWRSVCDDNFTAAVGTVACGQLGADFGSFVVGQIGSNEFWIDNILCDTTETELSECTGISWGVEDCSNNEHVGLTCELPVLLPGVVINEILYDPTGADGTGASEYVELHGPAGTSLVGASLVFYDGANGREYLRWDLSGTIPSDGFIVVGGASVSNVDLVASGPIQNAPDSVRLMSGSTVVDALAYGTFTTAANARGEGSPASGSGEGRSLSRVDSLDTDDNLADFISGSPSPGANEFVTVGLDLPFSGTGALTAADLTFTRPSEGCGLNGVSGFRYDTVVIENNTLTDYNVRFLVTWTGADGYLFAYSAFNPAAPTSGCLLGNDDNGVTTSSVLDFFFPADSVVTFVLTTYEPGDLPTYSWTLSEI